MSSSACISLSRKCIVQVSLLMAMLGVVCPGTVKAETPIRDLAGIFLGATPEEADEVIMKIDPNYEKGILKNNAGAIAGYQYRLRGDFLVKDFIYLRVLNSNRIWLVGRSQSFGEGERPTEESTLEVVRTKLGPESHLNSVDYMGGIVTVEWAFDRAETKYDGDLGSTADSPCTGNYNYVQSMTGTDISIPASFDKRCGKQAVSRFSKNKKDGMVDSFMATIIDTSAIYDQMTAEEEQKKQQAEARLADEKQKQNKPSI